jgi:hypothetical protein
MCGGAEHARLEDLRELQHWRHDIEILWQGRCQLLAAPA